VGWAGLTKNLRTDAVGGEYVFLISVAKISSSDPLRIQVDTSMQLIVPFDAKSLANTYHVGQDPEPVQHHI
jgi:hypothetical protein